MVEETGQRWRESLAARTFVEIADTLVADFDVIEMLTVLATRSVELLQASAAGILLADRSQKLRVMAASSETVELLELFQIQNDQGPCLDCYATGNVVTDDDLAHDARWPLFAPEAVRAGFSAVCAVPLRLRSTVLGCMNLFLTEPVPLSSADVALAQALADIASIALVQDRAARDAAAREQQLQHALNSRIVIEQAKGILAQRAGIDMEAAFAHLREYSRSHNRRLSEIANGLVTGAMSPDVIVAAASKTRAPRRT